MKKLFLQAFFLSTMLPGHINAAEKLVSELIREQFPQWAGLPIKPVEAHASDNITFRLGEKMSVRLPSAKCYAQQVKKEQKWLPILAQHITLRIPEPIVMGQPSKNYPWHWSIYQWIDGESANNVSIDEKYLNDIALQLVQFLHELHKIDTVNGPLPGPHNSYRGESLEIYDAQTRSNISQLKDFLDVNTCLSIWGSAIKSKWNSEPVWVHGDLSAGNFLVKDNKANAVIDFGLIAIGDPACDLPIAWTFFKNESRNIFKSGLNLDSTTWARARGWALWKTLNSIIAYKNPNHKEVKRLKLIIDSICSEHKELMSL